MQPFDYYKPKDFDEAFGLLNTPGKVIYPYAGGTDFIPMTRDGIWNCDAVVDVKGLPGMKEIQETPEVVKSAPSRTPVSRLDETLAARKPDLNFFKMPRT